MQNYVSLGNTLRKLREDKGVNQADLADFLKIERQTYSAYERDKSMPNIVNLRKLANYFSVSSDFLLGNEKKPEYSVYNSGSISEGAVVQGQNLGTVMVNNGDKAHVWPISDEAAELVKVYELLDVKRRHKLLDLAFSLEYERKQEIIKSQGELIE
jgi:transcriptional regulator with XRE-family HTH domain